MAFSLRERVWGSILPATHTKRPPRDAGGRQEACASARYHVIQAPNVNQNTIFLTHLP